MAVLDSLFPPLSVRAPLPPAFTPFLYFLGILVFFLPRNTSLRAAVILPAYIYLFLARPHYTAGSASENYNDATVYLLYPITFLDLNLLAPLAGRAPRWVGRGRRGQTHPSASPTTTTTNPHGDGEEDHPPFWSRAKFAFHLRNCPRGIGWDWEVKGVPAHPDAELSRWDFVVKHVLLAAAFWALKCASVYGMGLTTAVPNPSWTVRVARAWICGAWGYQGLSMLFHLLSAVTVAVGMSEPWEWPPMFGPLREAWSVRQMWSAVWHQMLRRNLQQPGIELSRFLGLAKGTLASKYLQLYVAFAISMISHEWNMYNAVGEDRGEFRFFMSQAVAITAEDFVQWCWRKVSGRTKKDQLTSFERVIGWIWTIVWFSYSLPAWATGMLEAGVLGVDADTAWARELGTQHALRLVRG